MEKLIGYTELTTKQGIIPIKLGMHALDLFMQKMGVDLDTIGALFTAKPDPNNPEQTIDVPKNYITFITTVIWAGATYASQKTNGREYSYFDASEWLEELGLKSPQIGKVFKEFYASIMNGGSVPDLKDESTASGKEAKKKAPEDS